MTVYQAYYASLCTIFAAAMAEANAPKYNPNPIIKLPLKPITIDDIAVNTVPITDAVTLIPQSRVTSSPPPLLLPSPPLPILLLLPSRTCSCGRYEEDGLDEEKEAILVMDGN